MQQYARILVFSGAGVVLLGTLLLLLLFGKPQTEPAEASSAMNPVVVLDKTAADLVSLHVKNDKGGYTLDPSLAEKDGETRLTFRVKELEGLPLDTTITDQAARSGYEITALKEIGEVEKPADFGFSPPRVEIEARFADETTFAYEVGGDAPGGDGAYLRAENRVYVVDVNPLLIQDKSVFLSTEILNFLQDGVPDFEKLTLDGTAVREPVLFDRTESGYAITNPTSAPVDADKAVAITDLLTSLNAERAEAVYPPEKLLAQYGLDPPAHRLQFTHAGKTYRLLAGTAAGDERFVMLEGVPVVYRVLEAQLSVWTGIGCAFDLRSKFLLDSRAEEVTSLRIERGSSAEEYRITRSIDDNKSTDQKTIYQYTVLRDGDTPVDFDTEYQSLFRKIANLTLLEQPGAPPEGDPVCVIEARRFDGGQESLSFYAMGNRRLIAVKNGEVCGNLTESDLAFLL